MNVDRLYMHAGCSLIAMRESWHRQVMSYFPKYGATKEVKKLYICVHQLVCTVCIYGLTQTSH